MVRFRKLWKIQRALAATLLAVGCAIKPLPGDYGLSRNTIDIVTHVRCEARYAIAKIAIFSLKKELKMLRNLQHQQKLSRAANEIVQKLESDNFRFEDLKKLYDNKGNLKKSKIGGLPEFLLKDLKIIEIFAKSNVGFYFELTTTEVNNLGGGLKFDPIISRGTFDVDFSGEYNRKRENIRAFSMAEKIADIVFDKNLIDLEYCNEKEFENSVNNSENLQIPINGSIELLESFRTYVELTLNFPFANALPKDVTTSKLKSRALTDSITFTTEVSGTLNPKITLSPARGVLKLGEASLKADNSRTAKHQLLLVLQPPTGADGQIEKVNNTFFAERIIRSQTNRGLLLPN